MCVVIIIQIVTAVALVFAATAAWRNVFLTKRALEANLWSGLIDKYFEPKMLDAMKLLRSKYDKMGGNLDKLTKDEIINDGNLNGARRQVKAYFVKIYKLANIKSIKDERIKKIVNEGNVAFFMQIIEILESKINEEYKKEPFKFFFKLYPNSRNPALMKRLGDVE